MKTTGIILSGGLSLRMGEDKGVIQLDEYKMVEKIIRLMDPFCDKLIISANNSNYDKFGLKVVNDKTDRIGPIGGIISCMREENSNFYLVMSCDTPNISNFTIAQLFDNLNNFDVVVYKQNNRIEPLISLFSKSATGKMEEEVKNKNFKLQDVIKKLNYNAILLEDNEKTKREFLNINAKEDLKKYYEE
jgi:molybdopterin-guanine dinucleotide biosynthesis protein A